MSDGIEKVLLIGGIGVAAYFVYEWLTTPATAAASAATTPTGCAAPNQMVGGECLPPAGASSTPAQGQSIASVFTALTAKLNATTDSAVVKSGGTINATPDVFNYYLAQVFTPTGSSPAGWPPDATQLFPGVGNSSTQTVSLTAYWAAVSAYLSSQMGMSGLGFFAGFGNFIAANNNYGWPEVAGPWGGGAGRAVQ